jgi:hypothetical protein
VTEFFVLRRIVASADETDFEEMAPVLGDAPRCPKCGLFVGSRPWLPAYRAIVRCHGTQLGDVAFGVGSSLLVSDEFRRDWESEDLRGLAQFAPLEELRVRPAKLATSARVFFHVRVEYGRTSIDEHRSVLARSEQQSCEQCKAGGALNRVHGFSIAESTWSGEDVFYTWGLPGTVVVTDRVRLLAERYALKNVHVTPVEDYVWDPLQRPTAKS